MKEIPLNKGKVALVDDEEYDFLINHGPWRAVKDGHYWYAHNNMGRMHRILKNISNPNVIVDHKDNNGLNNQKNNLRLTDKAGNARNSKKHKKCSSKYKGVSWKKSRNKWEAKITFSGKTRYIGLYKNEIEAALQYDLYASAFYGEFANLNFPKAEIRDQI